MTKDELFRKFWGESCCTEYLARKKFNEIIAPYLAIPDKDEQEFEQWFGSTNLDPYATFSGVKSKLKEAWMAARGRK